MDAGHGDQTHLSQLKALARHPLPGLQLPGLCVLKIVLEAPQVFIQVRELRIVGGEAFPQLCCFGLHDMHAIRRKSLQLAIPSGAGIKRLHPSSADRCSNAGRGSCSPPPTDV